MARFPIRLFNARRLAEELGRGEIGVKTRGYYLAASFLMFIPFNYIGLIYLANPIWSMMSIYEGILFFIITLIGFHHAYKAADGDTNPDFVAEFTCLSVPVFFTTTLIVWFIFWGITVGFREYVDAFELNPNNLPFIQSLHSIGANLVGLLSFLAVLSAQAIVFYKITQLFYIVRAQVLHNRPDTF